MNISTDSGAFDHSISYVVNNTAKNPKEQDAEIIEYSPKVFRDIRQLDSVDHEILSL